MLSRGTSVLAGLLGLFVSAAGSAAESEPSSAEQRDYWAFRPVTRPSIPVVDGTCLDPIDAFLRNGLRISGQSFLPPADKRTWIRRVTFDLTGLPPSTAEIEEFLADDSPDAHERLVDRLLASPHYGETWARVWLDVVRFAETAGFKEDPVRSTAYTYRDYVIRAANRDLPFPQFVEDQIAGDELSPGNAEALAATGYCRMWPDESNASNILLARQTALDDLTANVGAAFLGLSIGCAQCHNHKFDPLLQSDFYQLQAFFAGIVLEDTMPVGDQQQLAAYWAAERAWLAETAAMRQELNQLELPARVKMQGERRLKFPADVLQALDTPLDDRTTMQRQLAFWSARQMGVKDEEIPKHLTEAENAQRSALQQRLKDAQQRRPQPPRRADVMAVTELNQVPPATHLLSGGSYEAPREVVEPHIPVILRTGATRTPLAFQPPNERTSGRRTILAKWLGAADNPLTHRVWVNRIWQSHFGRGLVSNANDFGVLTPASRHPELHEWLTAEFLARGFESKRLHRRIVTSAAYRQQSRAGTDARLSDSYAGFPRLRLSSDRIRDAWLVAAGQLNPAMYGPGIRPEIPANFSSYEWKVSRPEEQARRSIYIFAKRNLPYPILSVFDSPDMHESCGCRTQTTVAPQALTLLNDRVVLDASRAFAQRARNEAGSEDAARWIQQAWLIAYSRPAEESEQRKALQFWRDQTAQLTVTHPDSKTAESEAFADMCHALINTNEFLFID